MRKYGLIGKKLGHSFSKKYFTEKFERENVSDATYDLYELESIDLFPGLLQRNPELCGLNVTVPYKEAVLPYLDKLDAAAARIGAVNAIRINDGKTEGYNTDYIGFKESLLKFYPIHEGSRALVLGTGGASKAVRTALDDLGISFRMVSRRAEDENLTYEGITPDLVQQYDLIINTTPLGMYPEVHTLPLLPYTFLTHHHHLYDLVYNPESTGFMEKGTEAGAQVMNGLEMLYRQAEAAWEVWNRNEC